MINVLRIFFYFNFELRGTSENSSSFSTVYATEGLIGMFAISSHVYYVLGHIH